MDSLLNAPNSIAAAALCLLAGMLLCCSLRYRRLQRELAQVAELTRSFCRGGAMPRRPAFSHAASETLWHLVMRVEARTRQTERAREAYREALRLGSTLAGVGDQQSALARAVIDVVLRQAMPELAGAAVILRDDLTADFRLAAAGGLPAERIEAALLAAADALADRHREGRLASGEYQRPGDNPSWDFSLFGIGLSLNVPLPEAWGLAGYLWLGFRTAAEPLTAERLGFVKALAEHAAASFGAARRSQERSQRSGRERDFLLGLSHDLRAPGNAALYAVRELLAGALGLLNGDQTRQLQLLESAISHQLDLLNDVFDYVKHQRGLLQADKKSVALQTLLREAGAQYRSLAEQKNVAFIFDCPQDIRVHADPRHVRRIAANLFSNAVKYTDAGAITVRCLAAGSECRLQVTDTGAGVPQAERPHLFHEFRRGSAGGGRDGIGLGLAVSKLLAEANGGSLVYRPNDGAGSIFELSLQTMVSDTRPGCEQRVFESVLIVDDDPCSCRTIGRYLAASARRIVAAGSLDEACKALDREKPALIVTDFRLPDGEAAILLSRVEAGTPVVVATGSRTEAAVRLPFVPGAAIIEKPISRAGLSAAIDSAAAAARRGAA